MQDKIVRNAPNFSAPTGQNIFLNKPNMTNKILFIMQDIFSSLMKKNANDKNVKSHLRLYFHLSLHFPSLHKTNTHVNWPPKHFTKLEKIIG